MSEVVSKRSTTKPKKSRKTKKSTGEGKVRRPAKREAFSKAAVAQIMKEHAGVKGVRVSKKAVVALIKQTATIFSALGKKCQENLEMYNLKKLTRKILLKSLKELHQVSCMPGTLKAVEHGIEHGTHFASSPCVRALGKDGLNIKRKKKGMYIVSSESKSSLMGLAHTIISCLSSDAGRFIKASKTTVAINKEVSGPTILERHIKEAVSMRGL